MDLLDIYWLVISPSWQLKLQSERYPENILTAHTRNTCTCIEKNTHSAIRCVWDTGDNYILTSMKIDRNTHSDTSSLLVMATWEMKGLLTMFWSVCQITEFLMMLIILSGNIYSVYCHSVTGQRPCCCEIVLYIVRSHDSNESCIVPMILPMRGWSMKSITFLAMFSQSNTAFPFKGQP